MPNIAQMSLEDFRNNITESNKQAMKKHHKYPEWEGWYLRECCEFVEPTCPADCYCRRKGNNGVWVIRPDLAWETFVEAYASLWARGSHSFIEKVKNAHVVSSGHWAVAIDLLRDLKNHWPNWDGNNSSLPSIINRIRLCHFCDDAFRQIRGISEEITRLSQPHDNTGVYTSKLVSQLFYDVAVPFDTQSKRKLIQSKYLPKSYGDGYLLHDFKAFVERNDLTIAQLRKMDDASQYWESVPSGFAGTALSRLLDKQFYG